MVSVSGLENAADRFSQHYKPGLSILSGLVFASRELFNFVTALGCRNEGLTA